MFPKTVAYCNAGCREDYREDRRAGLIYGQGLMPDGTLRGWDTYCAAWGVCPYCGEVTNEARHDRAIETYLRFGARLRRYGHRSRYQTPPEVTPRIALRMLAIRAGLRPRFA
jgi:hypothetical protein